MKTPNTKHQTPEKHQAPSTTCCPRTGCMAQLALLAGVSRLAQVAQVSNLLYRRLPIGRPFDHQSAAKWRFEVWCLVFLWCLVFGVWCFRVSRLSFKPL
ncbi:MAG: hypothetical protein C5B50_29755 [Verrucomicrobia bacterium]|nr:MAG: hypothetical protein C5B50_29755 [Verrucomicrobiota bacterium]